MVRNTEPHSEDQFGTASRARKPKLEPPQKAREIFAGTIKLGRRGRDTRYISPSLETRSDLFCDYLRSLGPASIYQPVSSRQMPIFRGKARG